MRYMTACNSCTEIVSTDLHYGKLLLRITGFMFHCLIQVTAVKPFSQLNIVTHCAGAAAHLL